MKAVFIGVGALLSPFVFVLGVIIVAAGGSTSAAAAGSDLCTTAGPLHGLSSIAAGNARTVVAVAEPQVGSDGAAVAVMTAYTESGLRVLGNPLAGTASAQGVGYDHDSVGLFQQRASWGTAAQRLDPQASTRLFVGRLMALSNWRSLLPWVAAQAVQISAFDGHARPANHFSSVVGGNYESNYALAQQVVERVDHDSAALACGSLSGGLPASVLPGTRGLPDAYSIPPDATARQATVVRYALAQLQRPYVFGAAGPTAFDCSGLTLAAWRQVGVTLVHDTVVQAREGVSTTADALEPGDLVLVPGDDGTLAAPGHVGLYIGRGLVLNAADEQDGIRVQTYDNFVLVGHGLSALRHIA